MLLSRAKFSWMGRGPSRKQSLLAKFVVKTPQKRADLDQEVCLAGVRVPQSGMDQ